VDNHHLTLGMKKILPRMKQQTRSPESSRHITPTLSTTICMCWCSAQLHAPVLIPCFMGSRHLQRNHSWECAIRGRRQSVPPPPPAAGAGGLRRAHTHTPHCVKHVVRATIRPPSEHVFREEYIPSLCFPMLCHERTSDSHNHCRLTSDVQSEYRYHMK